MKVPEIPVLRRGSIYRSLDTQSIPKLGTSETAVKIHMANSGLVKRDLQKVGESRKTLEAMKCADLVQMIRNAGDHFLHDSLPVGDSGQMQSPEDYVVQLGSTSGLPHALIRMNMKRLHQVFDEIEVIIKGLSRGLDLEVLDRGYGTQSGVPVSYAPLTDSLAVILPSNSPAVNALWIPALALKMPVVLKPGREEPWTPWRVIQAMVKAGIPIEAFSFYPTDHDGSGAILRRAGRVMMFGDDATVAQYANDPRVEVHGTGHSKIVLGDDEADNWEQYLDLMVESVTANSGRSCINVSTIMTPRHAETIARALADRLKEIRPLDAEDPEARLSGFANPKFAEYIDSAIDDD